MSVGVLGQDGLYLGVDLLLEDGPQEVQGLSGVGHHGVMISRHGHLNRNVLQPEIFGSKRF